ncbi:MAG TPA: hypothetical protein VM008_12025 [Phycisphaerae bacterium]|nr:hypothetical protein [Phycisphaerae bacterium]
MTTTQGTLTQKVSLDVVWQYLRQPLWIAALTLAGTLLLVSWMASRDQAVRQIAARNIQNAVRIKRAAMDLAMLIPPQMSGDSGRKISALVDQALHSASVSDHQLRTQSIRTLGAVGQTGVSKLQARVEIVELSLAQAGSIVQAIERSGEPVWIESSDLTASSQNQWNLVLEIDWLQKQSN